MRKNKKNKYLLLLILLLGISVGFAALSTQLKINGTANISKQSWNVYWDEESIAITEGSKGNTEPEVVSGDDGTAKAKVTWEVTLDLPGDFYEFTIDAANAGTVDAMITGITPTVPANLPSYISYSVTYADGIVPAENHLLAKGTKSGNTIIPTTQKYKVRVEYLDTVTPDDLDDIDDEGDTYQFSYAVTYGQATNAAIPKPIKWILPEGKTMNTLAVGDELCAKGECFNFIKYDGNDVVMLAKYNLKVGNIIDGDTYTATDRYTSSNPGYNKQSSETIGYVTDAATFNGTVPFSATNYWDAISSYPADVYDATNYKTEPNFSTTCDYSTNCFQTPGYSVAYYVDAYKTILTNLGAIVKEARLLTYSDVTDSSIGCSTSGGCPTTGASSFVTNTTYWLGSADDYDYMWGVYFDGDFTNNYSFDDEYTFGVRPVIIVEKSNL